MSLITWTKEQFGTNVSAHDNEHQIIFDMLNSLHSTASGSDRGAIGNQLDALISYVAEHFGSEEKNMAASNYPDLARHKEEHDKLVGTCVELQKSFHAGDAEVTQETTTFLSDWLKHHIPTIDRSYGPTMNSNGIN